MKKKTLRILAITLAIVTIVSTILPISSTAATPKSQQLIWTGPAVTANLSKNPNISWAIPKLNELTYINYAATSDFKIKSIRVEVKSPGESNYQTVKNYMANNYCRYLHVPYIFSMEGVYSIRITVTDIYGKSMSGEMVLSVEEDENINTSSQKIHIPWTATSTTTTRNANDKFTINGIEIVPGSIHATYLKNGTKSTSGSAYYCKYNNKLTYVGGAQCLNYIYYLQLLLFGVDSHTTILQNSEKDDGVSSFFGVRYYKKLSASEYKKLLQYTGEGTHLRCLYNSKTEHSIFVLKVEDKGFYFTDANTSSATYGANNIKLGYTTFEDFANGNYSYLKYVEYYHS